MVVPEVTVKSTGVDLNITVDIACKVAESKPVMSDT